MTVLINKASLRGATHKQSVIAWPQQTGEDLHQRVIARRYDEAICCELIPDQYLKSGSSYQT
jgi:hypothetical protein